MKLEESMSWHLNGFPVTLCVSENRWKYNILGLHKAHLQNSPWSLSKEIILRLCPKSFSPEFLPRTQKQSWSPLEIIHRIYSQRSSPQFVLEFVPRVCLQTLSPEFVSRVCLQSLSPELVSRVRPWESNPAISGVQLFCLGSKCWDSTLL